MARFKKYKTPDELLKKGNEYFDFCGKNFRPLTMAGLALFLGFTSRQTIYEYRKDPEFTEVIDFLKLRIEEWNTNLLYETGRSDARVNQNSVLFVLRATLGVRDVSVVENVTTTKNEKIDFSKIPDDKLDEFISLLESATKTDDSK